MRRGPHYGLPTETFQQDYLGPSSSVHPRSKIGTHTHTFGPTRVYFGQTAPTVLSLDDSDLRNPGTHVTKHGQTQKKAMFKACSGKKGRLRP